MIRALLVIFMVAFVFAYLLSDYKMDGKGRLVYKKNFVELIKDYPNILALLDDPVFLDKIKSQTDENSGLTDLIEHLIKFGADVNAKDAAGEPALFKLKKPEKLQLIAAGADVNVRDAHGQTLLMRLDGDDTSLVERLIEAGADLHAKDDDGKTVLMHATPQMTDLLLKHEIMIDDVDKNGCTALQLASNAIKTYLLIHAGADVNHEDLAGNEPILSVVEARSAELLVEAGAKLNVSNNAGRTVLMTPAVASRDVFVRAIDAGVDVNAVWTDESGESRTTLMALLDMSDDWLDRETRLERVEALIRAKAEVNAQNNRGKTALMFARDASLIRRLVMVGADLSQCDHEGNTPLMYATCRAVVEALVEAGVDVNAKNKIGRTALMLAPNVETARALLELGADKNIAMPSGLIAEDLVKDENVKNVIRKWEKV